MFSLFQHRDDEEAGDKCVDEEFGREQPRTDRHTSFSCVPSRLVAYFQYLVDYPPLRYLFLLFVPLFLLLLVRPILISDNISGLHSGTGGEDERSKGNVSQTNESRKSRRGGSKRRETIHESSPTLATGRKIISYS